MANQSVKILVCGDVEGKFSQLFQRVATVNSKSGPFEMLLCVGNFFGEDNSQWKSYVDGTLKVPIPTYILGPACFEHKELYKDADAGELCENVMCLGAKGVFTGSSGLKIAYLSGLECPNMRPAGSGYHFTGQDVEALVSPLIHDSGFKGVDILMTSPWPKGVDKYAVSPENLDSFKKGSALVAHLSRALRPRYHFCGIEGVAYERLPYRNHQVLLEAARHATRFIALAKVGNRQKARWLYAFSITPLPKMDVAELVRQPPDVTESPFHLAENAANQQQQDKPDDVQFFFDMASPTDGHHRGKKRYNEDQEKGNRKQPRNPPQPTGPCWFCLGSPQVEKHLVVSIGTNVYLTLAKGGLTPDHVLILPVAHYQSTIELPLDAMEEIEKYKTALVRYFKSKKKGVVFFERNYRTQHLQIQVVPVPESTIEVLKSTFCDVAEEQEVVLDEIPRHSDITQILSPGRPYFYVELPGNVKLLHRIRGKFPLQFGREVLASPPILNMENRADWRQCSSTKEEEASDAQAFKKKFKDFDFTI